MNAWRFIHYALSGCIAAAMLASCGGPAAMQPPALSAAAIDRPMLPGDGSYKSFNSDILGCPYPSGDVWEKDIRGAQIDPSSAANIKATIDAGGGSGFDAYAPKTDELVNQATYATPLVPVQGKVKWHTPYSPWPWTSGFYIEPLSDAHAMVLQTQNCQYYEAYSVSYVNGTLSMYNGGKWDLTAPFVRPAQGAISTASGIPFGLLAVRPEELTAGVVDHALGWDGVRNTWSQSACVSPAGVSDCTDDIAYKGPSGDNPMPYGAHIRLKASFNDATFPKEAKIVAKALKHYGAYAYDTGCCNAVVFINDRYGAPAWTGADASALAKITVSNFDRVVAP